MKIVFPMAGFGQRFVQAGYTDYKPLVPVLGRPMMAHVLEMFNPDDSFVFVCSQAHIDNGLGNALLKLAPNGQIVGIAPHSKGPVHTTTAAYDYITDDEPIIVCYCDGAVHWNRQEFFDRVATEKLDGMLFTHTGFHPHTISNTKMAFLKVADGRMLEIKEKSSYTDNPMSEHASSGIYYFNSGALVKKYFTQLIQSNTHHNGEFYVTLVYNLMVRDGLRIGYYDTEDTAIFGTPEEVQNFEAWATILQGHQVRNEEDALRCYRYWTRITTPI